MIIVQDAIFLSKRVGDAFSVIFIVNYLEINEFDTLR